MIKSLKGKTQVHVLTITHFSGSYSFCNSQGLGMTKLRCPGLFSRKSGYCFVVIKWN